MSKRLAYLLALSFVIPLMAFVTPVSAQDDDEKKDDEAYKEEITVTSRKREEKLQDVPMSVAAPTEEQLRQRGATDLEGVSANVAGFNVQNLGPGQSQIAIRGVSAGQVVRDQPGVKEQVGVYLDESVVSLSLFTPDIDLFDMSRVEILRGPQGTLFGSGSLSGTVRYITNQPEIGVTESFGEFGLGSIGDGADYGDAKLAFNFGLGDNAATRIVAYRTGLGGYIDSVQPNTSVRSDTNDGDRTGLRWAFRFEPNENLVVTPRLILQNVETDGWNRIDDYNILANPFTTTRPAIDLGERQNFTQIEEPFEDDFMLFDLNIDYDFGDMQFKSITSITDREVVVIRDATALTASITGGSLGLDEDSYSISAPLDDTTEVDVLTQEFRLSGGNDRTNWVAGAFYSTIERAYDQRLLVDGFEAASGISTAGLAAPMDVLFYSDLDYEFDQIAVFGEVTTQITDTFDITAGLRWYDFDEDRTQIFDGIFGNDDNGTLLVETAGSTTADGVVPRVIGSWKVSDRTNLNAQISKGFRLGGINDPLNVPLCSPEDLITFGGRDSWEDEELWNYEVGAKSTVMGGRGVFNVAAFYMDISDLQATVTAGTCSSRIIFNVPEAESKGVELEFAGATSENFDFAISASYNDSELGSTVTTTSGGSTSVVSGIQEGNRLPTVPEFQAAAAATYQWLADNDRLYYLTGTYQHVGSRFTQVGDQAAGFGTVDLTAFDPTPIGGPLTDTTFTFMPELPSYDVINLRFGLTTNQFDISLFANNITDEIAFLALDQERGTLARVGYLTNQPRTIGVGLKVNFN